MSKLLLHIAVATVLCATIAWALFIRPRMRPTEQKPTRDEMNRRFIQDQLNLTREIRDSGTRKQWLDLEIEIDTFCWYYQNHISTKELDNARKLLYAVWYEQEKRHRPGGPAMA